jgi:hypothetical protein
MRTPRIELNDAKSDLWWQACRLQEWSLLQSTRLPLQNQSGKEHA